MENLYLFQYVFFHGRETDGKQLKPYTTTFEVPESWSEKTARKKPKHTLPTFERECKTGIRSDTKKHLLLTVIMLYL